MLANFDMYQRSIFEGASRFTASSVERRKCFVGALDRRALLTHLHEAVAHGGLQPRDGLRSVWQEHGGRVRRLAYIAKHVEVLCVAERARWQSGRQRDRGTERKEVMRGQCIVLS